MQRKVLAAPGFPDMCVCVFVFCISVFVFVAVIVLLTMACAAPWLPPEPQALVAAGHRKCRPALSPLLPLAQLTQVHLILRRHAPSFHLVVLLHIMILHRHVANI